MSDKARQMTIEEHAARLSEKLGTEWKVVAKQLPDGHIRFESTRKTPQ